jgi:glycogen synthase
VRIVMTTDSAGGVWAYTMELCKALEPYGHQVLLACLGGPAGAADRSIANSLPNVTLEESRYRLEWMEDPWEDLQRASEWLQSLLRKWRADLLHLNCYGALPPAREVPVLLVTHSCVLSWWRATHGEDAGPEWARYGHTVTRALAGADRIIAPTGAMLAAVNSCYPQVNCAGRTGVIRNGISPDDWSGAREEAEPFVLGVGRPWDEGKNLQQLAAVAPDLGCPVVIAGAGALKGVSSPTGVVMLGALPRKDLASCYRRATIFAHPARYEPFGLAVLEAALSGCPLVLGDIPSLRELWEGAARFVAPDDTEGWRETLRELLDDPVARRQLGESALSRAANYPATRMAAAYSEQYRKLVDVPARGVA